jgi:hypothetical protein
MSRYTIVNLLAAILVVGVGVLLRRRRRLSRTMKISMVAPLLSFPWLYFGVTQKAWSHGDPGLVLMGVPLNEVALSFIMTFVNSGIFILNYQAIIDETSRSAKPKDCTPEKKEDHPVR